MADFAVGHRRQAGRHRQALVANQVVCVEFGFFFIHTEMMRFLGWECVTSVTTQSYVDAYSFGGKKTLDR